MQLVQDSIGKRSLEPNLLDVVTRLPAIPKLHHYSATMTNKISSPLLLKYSTIGSLVLDPFCGSGNVLKTAALLGRNSVGIDINPLAVHLSKVSTTSYNGDELESILARTMADLERVELPEEFLERNNIRYWFSDSALGGLYSIKNSINDIPENRIREFFKICLSATVRKVSRADPSIPPPVYSKEMRRKHINHSYDDVLDSFYRVSKQNIRIVREMSKLLTKRIKTSVYCADTLRSLSTTRKRFDLILTSPPYLSAQKYTRTTSLELMIVFDMSREQLREIDRVDIGSEKVNSSDIGRYSRGPFMSSLLNGRQVALLNRFTSKIDNFLGKAIRVLRDEGYLAMIVGDNTINGSVVPIARTIENLAKKRSLSVIESFEDRIVNYSFFTKRNKNAGLIKYEHIIVFRKE